MFLSRCMIICVCATQCGKIALNILEEPSLGYWEYPPDSSPKMYAVRFNGYFL